MAVTISACMIVRDEARLLSRCLRSLRDVFDELCVVDTGSADRSAEVARKFGAAVKTISACNGPDGRMQNFSIARNASLDMAHGDWIFVIDADEVLEPGSARAIRKVVSKSRAEALKVQLTWNKVTWRPIRLFRNSPHHRYLGRVHEYITFLNRVESAQGIAIRHLPDKRGKESSTDRNLRLCEAELLDNPESPRALYYLGNELSAAGRLDEAILRYYQQLALGGGHRAQAFRARQSIAECYLAKGEWPEAIDAGLRALRVDPRYAETHCLIGDACFALGDWAFAQHWFRSALACKAPPPESPTFLVPAAYNSYPRARLRACDSKLRSRKPIGGPG